MAGQVKEKRTLLQTYNIPVGHLSFEYIETCNDGKYLERIVRILRSGEEGSYPQLLKCAEDKLRLIMPRSNELIVTTSMLTKDNGYEFYRKAIDDIKEFRKEMVQREQELKRKRRKTAPTDLYPVRETGKILYSEVGEEDEPKKVQTQVPKKTKSVVPRSFPEWDKYDPDRELLRMGVEDEKKAEEDERKKKRKETSHSKKKLELVKANLMDIHGDYTEGERKFHSCQEKDKGNVFFNQGEYLQAIEHYNTSIQLHPTANSYNNRAMANLKLKNYPKALMDCNKVLEMEPNNAKALMRRGTAYQNESNFQKALEDFSRVAVLEPENRLARGLIVQMQEKCDWRRKSVRMKIIEEDSGKRGVPNWVRNPPSECFSSDEENLSGESSNENAETDDPSASSVINNVKDENVLKTEPALNVSEEYETEKGSGDMNNKEKLVIPAKEINKPVVPSATSVRTVDNSDLTALQPTSTKQVRVRVASKYTKNVSNTREERPKDAKGIEDLSLEDNSTSKITTACDFLYAWHNAKSKSDPSHFVLLLRRINPADLHSLIGNKLTGEMLTTLLNTLEHGFLHDPPTVLTFLQHIVSLQRFNIVKLFEQEENAPVVQRLFESLEKSGYPPPEDLQDAFLK